MCLSLCLTQALGPPSPGHVPFEPNSVFLQPWGRFFPWCLLVPACQGQEHWPYPAVLGSEISGPVGDLGLPIVYDLPQDRDLGHLVKAAVGIGWLQEGDEATGWKGRREEMC